VDDTQWIELAVDACNHAGIEYGTIEPIATWDQEYRANAVYRLGGQRYLKLFGPTAERQFHVERAVLRTLEAHSSISAPHIIAEGNRRPGPPYLVLSEVPGSTAEQVWDILSRSEQLAIARDLGVITAAIHRLPQQELLAVEQQYGGRLEQIRREQARRIAHIDATEALSAQQRSDMIHFLKVEAAEHLDGPPTLAHCELAHNHLYLSRETGAWHVSGLIDWADAMLGPPEWDVTFLWFWTFSRDREAMRTCLKALYAVSPRPEHFARRCLAAILHTHSGPALWAEFAEQAGGPERIVQTMTEYLFPPEVFGPPD